MSPTIPHLLESIPDRLKNMDDRLCNMDGRLSNMDGRLSNMDARLSNMDGRLSNMDGRLMELDAANNMITSDSERIGKQLSDLNRWLLFPLQRQHMIAVIPAALKLFHLFAMVADTGEGAENEEALTNSQSVQDALNLLPHRSTIQKLSDYHEAHRREWERDYWQGTVFISDIDIIRAAVQRHEQSGLKEIGWSDFMGEEDVSVVECLLATGVAQQHMDRVAWEGDESEDWETAYSEDWETADSEDWETTDSEIES